MKNLRNLVKEKRKSQKGFTLMEMLIVVAIIAVLVAISIPVFNTQLEKAREQADAANMRAAKAVAIAQYLMEEKGFNGFYDAEEGVIKTDRGDVDKGYGKGTASGDVKEDHADRVIKVGVTADGAFTGSWEQ